MSSRFRTPIVAMALALVVVIFDVAAGQEGMRRDARETAPEALIGTWELNVARSTYTGGARPPQSQVRNFDYTYDAMILCHGVTVNANGNRSEFHWAVTLDGADHPEYARGQGSTVPYLVGMKKMDEHTLRFTTRRRGRLIQTGEWKLSEDGNTLTQTLNNLGPDGQPTGRGHVAVFEKQH